MMTSVQIRQAFLDFFQSKQHHIVPSAPIVVKNDPTLLFTNAGMNQFKDYFLGNKKAPYQRVADTQKCLRVSGKHNDLEEVGVDTYHHTMFEMLGNWSFGDPLRPEGGYFKQEAIAWSWELLTSIYNIPKERLYVTIFEGDEKEGMPADEEAYNEWKKVIAEDRILKGKKKDNFWEMGDTGPCGPCTEIHVDCRSEEERKITDGKTLVNNDHPQVIEIWNNVFIQFNRLKNGKLEPLPARHVDTGMGFERLVRVLQGKNSNYDTDIFTGTIAAIEKITAQKYDFSDSRQAVAFRVLADHIRAISFTIADGQLPSSTGAGYVIRRILRRAVRYYYSYLNYRQPLLHQLVMDTALQFKYVFPELYEQAEFVIKVVREEEDAFLRTLEKGLKRIDDIIGAAHDSRAISGRDAFELYDTYGFPFDLTRLIADENKLTVDQTGFEKEMQEQKNRSRAATAIDTEDWIEINKTGKFSFVGYNDLLVETRVIKYRKVKAKAKEQYQLVLETTPFYAESGGQVGDTGTLQFGDEKIAVTDTKKENNLIIHFTGKLPSDIALPVVASVNFENRLCTMYNHTATHLLHAALQQVLGRHVAQKGSLVSPGELRFDFSHFAKVTEEEIRKAELLVNEKIRRNIPVVIKEMPKEEALQMGAMALFGEKYGDIVRVVIIDPDYSVELCGGTHVSNTGMIGLFAIVSESAVAAGVRRVEALTGPAAIQYSFDKISEYKHISELLKAKDPLKAIEKLIEDKNALQKKVESLEARQLVQIRNELLQKDETINGVTFIGDIVQVSHADALKKICFDVKNNLRDYVMVLCANINGKPFVAIGMSDVVAAAKQLDAAKIIKEHIAPLIKGGGGGQKTLATAGGQDASQLPLVIAKVKSLL
ncbi:alanine--tRNA ligase [Agriterribacter sp.]|uniref:alanine--tRNA ligase n=1 Tax=Agriterribacter sp. TaxID=2821509 RepID=UPI002C95D78C|nr:alanine--tRNA ligase [Agriterribacter sp.]HRP55975.1 alanine--tRNA ligase [Agriterribacter sp.]